VTGIQIQRFDTGMGRIEAHMITEKDQKEIRQQYVEVYYAGQTDPAQLIAWFGDVESFTKWISGAEIRDF
jgi:hypothetical protein